MRKSLELRPERTWTVNTICENPCDAAYVAGIVRSGKR